MQDSHVYVRGPSQRPHPTLLMFTPAQWRHILEDRDFLRDPDNRYAIPRKLMGVPVAIVPDHDTWMTLCSS
jgi:hypothetical protein